MQLINYSLITLHPTLGRTDGRTDGGRAEGLGREDRGCSRLISDYLAKISLKCCSCGNDIIRVRQGQLAVIKVGQGEGKREMWEDERAREDGREAGGQRGMNEIKAGSEDDRLHGSTSARVRSLSLCRDNKTNLHTGQLAPGRMSRVSLYPPPPSLPFSLPSGTFSSDRRADGVIGALGKSPNCRVLRIY